MLTLLLVVIVWSRNWGGVIGKVKFKDENNSNTSGGGYVWGKVYKCKIFQNIHFPPNYWFEDTLASMIIADLSKNNVTISEIVYDYMQNPHGITKTSHKKPRCLDSYWVTMRLVKDRANLGMQITQRFYDQMLKQICWNCVRVASIDSCELNKALFSCHVHLLKDYLNGWATSQKLYKDLEQSLRNADYSRYFLFCLLVR